MKVNHLLSMYLIFLSTVLIGCSKRVAPDTIFYNGSVVTVDNTNSIHNAVAVKDGKINLLGSNNEILSSADDKTVKVNLNGDTLIPGFVGVHEHPTLEAVFENTIDISGFSHKTAAAMWKHLEEQINSSPKGEWVFAMGIEPILFPDMHLPTMTTLDEIAPNNPLVLISQTMHSFWANTKAFNEAGITSDTPDPGHGSYYDKDDDGNLTGFIAEAEAASPFLAPLKSPLNMLNSYEQVLDNYLSDGYTTVASLGFNAPIWLAKYAALEKFQYKIRQFYYLTADELDMLPGSPENGDDFFSVLGVKLWHDGSPYTGSMQLETPYVTSHLTKSLGLKPDHKGTARLSTKEFNEQVALYSNAKWQIAVHSQGDQSSKIVAEALSAVPQSQNDNTRPRVEHGLLISKESLSQMAEAGVTPSFHINHIYYYGDALANDIIGTQRAQNVLLVKDAFELNMHPTLHADGPMFPTSPFHLMQTSVTRQSSNGLILGEPQGITPEQALKAVTYNGAWQLSMESKIGSLEVGKYADLVRISDNPFTKPIDQWQEIEVLETWVEGKLRFIK